MVDSHNCLSTILGSIPCLSAIVEGLPHAQKTVTHMLMPVFICWALMIMLTCVAYAINQRWMFRSLFVVIILYWIASSAWLSDWLVARIESSITPWSVDHDPPLDTIVVFGGGTGLSPHDQAQVSSAGDRVVRAARLYHLGKTKRLITTGASLDQTDQPRRNPSVQTREIWEQLQIPSESISEIGGINTFEELQQLRSHPWAQPPQRVGLLSSAFHVPRIVRLAKAAGIDGIAVASDYRTNNDSTYRIRDFLPSAGSAIRLEMVLKEHLAAWVGR